MTLWHPDTCSCQITIDDAGPTQYQTSGFVVQCPAHSSHTHSDVLAENQTKNKALNDIQAAHPGNSVTWAFNPDRSLTYTVGAGTTKGAAYSTTPGTPVAAPTAAALAATQAQLDTTYGAGKVVLKAG